METFTAHWLQRDLGHRIKARRKYLGVSQQKLADHLGIDRAGISRAEKGGVKTIDFLVRICRALGLKIQISLDYDDDSPFSTFPEVDTKYKKKSVKRRMPKRHKHPEEEKSKRQY